jgi:hypothetical protein
MTNLWTGGSLASCHLGWARRYGKGGGDIPCSWLGLYNVCVQSCRLVLVTETGQDMARNSEFRHGKADVPPWCHLFFSLGRRDEAVRVLRLHSQLFTFSFQNHLFSFESYRAGFMHAQRLYRLHRRRNNPNHCQNSQKGTFSLTYTLLRSSMSPYTSPNASRILGRLKNRPST